MKRQQPSHGHDAGTRTRAGRPRRVWLAALLAIALLAAPAARADDPVVYHGSGGDFTEITAELRQAVHAGLEFLAEQQQADGSFGSDRYGRHVGITALAGLAFLAHGDVPGRGLYGDNVQRALGFIISSQEENGLLAADVSHGPMYGHGFATLFLAEVYGQTHDPRIREVLVKAVRLIIGSQNSEGGWRYQPVPSEADTSVTVCQVKALRAARNAGVKIPRETIDKAIEYIRRCQNPDGGFRYMLNSGNSAFPRSAASVVTLYAAGVHDDEAIDRGLEYLLQHVPGDGRNPSHYFYGQYYGVQAMFFAGGDYWRQWFPAIRDELLNRQNSRDGSWDGQAGRDYGTAMALIILQMPNRYLPIFQR